jgi:acylphosphatase
MPSPRQRWTLHFSAAGARAWGFEHRPSTSAAGFAVTGYVRNLSDGRVELVAEGTATELRGFLDELRVAARTVHREQTPDRGCGER